VASETPGAFEILVLEDALDLNMVVKRSTTSMAVAPMLSTVAIIEKPLSEPTSCRRLPDERFRMVFLRLGLPLQWCAEMVVPAAATHTDHRDPTPASSLIGSCNGRT
jgi:hypothetical protein